MVNTCENCGGVIGKLETPHVWREAVVCVSCHRRLASPAGPIAPAMNFAGPTIVYQPSPAAASLQCPGCGSTSLKALSMVHNDGITNNISQFSGVATRGGLFAGSSGGTSVTVTAARAVPPVMKSYTIGGWAIVIGFVVLMVGFANVGERGTGAAPAILAGALIGAAGVWGVLRASKWNATEGARLLQIWRQSWMCMACGMIQRPLIDGVDNTTQVRSRVIEPMVVPAAARMLGKGVGKLLGKGRR